MSFAYCECGMGYSDERFTVENQPEWSPVRWAFNVWTWVLIAGAVAAFEIFGDPLLAGLIVCLKFGGRDLWAAYLFRYHDPYPNRGVMLSYFCVGVAFLKIASAGLLTMVLVYATLPWFGGAGQFNRLMAGMVMQFAGIFVAMAAIIAGTLQTGPSNFRPWLDCTLYKNLRWRNPVLRCEGSRNRIWRLLILGIIASTVTLLVPLVVIVLERIWTGKFEPKEFGGLVTLGLFWLATMWLWLGTWRYVARKPEECWPESKTTHNSPIR